MYEIALRGCDNALSIKVRSNGLLVYLTEFKVHEIIHYVDIKEKIVFEKQKKTKNGLVERT